MAALFARVWCRLFGHRWRVTSAHAPMSCRCCSRVRKADVTALGAGLHLIHYTPPDRVEARSP